MTTKLMVTKSTVQNMTRKSPKSFTWKKNINVWKHSKQGSCIFEDCFCPVPSTPYL